jgi:hypothetical protein
MTATFPPSLLFIFPLYESTLLSRVLSFYFIQHEAIRFYIPKNL